MKILFILTLVLSSSAFAKSRPVNFNRVENQFTQVCEATGLASRLSSHRCAVDEAEKACLKYYKICELLNTATEKSDDGVAVSVAVVRGSKEK